VQASLVADIESCAHSDMARSAEVMMHDGHVMPDAPCCEVDASSQQAACDGAMDCQSGSAFHLAYSKDDAALYRTPMSLLMSDFIPLLSPDTIWHPPKA
jgi:hypothetical protein